MTAFLRYSGLILTKRGPRGVSGGAPGQANTSIETEVLRPLLRQCDVGFPPARCDPRRLSQNFGFEA
jgi:hypothetical protein